MKTHALKTWPTYFEAVWAGDKTFEARPDDRGFEVGDDLVLNEWIPELDVDGTFVYDDDLEQVGRYTGRRIRARVTYLLRGGSFGVEPGYVVLALYVTMRHTGPSPAGAVAS